MRAEPGLGLGLPGTAPLLTAPPNPAHPSLTSPLLAPPPPAEWDSVMGGCAGLAGGCAPHILNHNTVLPQMLQRDTNSFLSVLVFKGKTNKF